MKIRFQLLLAFLIIAITAFMNIGFSFFQTSKTIKESVIQRAKSSISEITQNQALNHLEENVFKTNNFEEVAPSFDAFFEEISSSEVFRIKVWNTDSQVIYSDQKEIVGEVYLDNDALQRAIKGEVIVEIQEPIKSDNFFEQGYEQLMEIYTPIISSSDDEVIGVIETYAILDSLNEQVSLAQYQLGLTELWSAFVVIFVLIFLYVLITYSISSPLERLKIAADKINKGEYNHAININSNDEIGQLGKTFEEMRVKIYERHIEMKDEIDSKTEELKQKNEELEDSNSQLKEKNKEIQSTLEHFYTIRTDWEKELLDGTVNEENQKLLDRLNKKKKNNEEGSEKDE